jgi:hypothetical protein
MARGGTLLLLSGSLAAVGCTMDHNVHVRPIADAQAKMRSGGGLLNHARGQLALGNVGLALEAFRTLQREQPESADAFAGIAACYAAMGRYDLARANYEFALAYAPNDPMLLYALASSLEHLGEGEQAVQVRAEAARLSAAPAGQVKTAEAAVTSIGVPQRSSITVKVPAAVAAPKPAAPEIAPPRLVNAVVSLPVAGPIIMKRPALRVDGEMSIAATEEPPKVAVAPAPLIAALEEPPKAAVAPSASIAPPQLFSAQVDLPAARRAVLPARALAISAEISIPVEREAPLPVPTRAPSPNPASPPVALRSVVTAETGIRVSGGPYLERKSPGEVALVTSPRPAQQLQTRISKPQELAARGALAPADRSNGPMPRPLFATALRWVPLKFASAPQNVVLLNAARSQGLAARTRSVLAGRGWRSIGIGNAREQRERSLVLYPATRAFIARRLAAHFGCKALKSATVKSIVVLLGREAVLRRSSRA